MIWQLLSDLRKCQTRMLKPIPTLYHVKRYPGDPGEESDRTARYVPTNDEVLRARVSLLQAGRSHDPKAGAEQDLGPPNSIEHRVDIRQMRV